jgi:hypothetical protein
MGKKYDKVEVVLDYSKQIEFLVQILIFNVCRCRYPLFFLSGRNNMSTFKVGIALAKYVINRE